jgi:uncharacterized membrane protein YgcG
MFLTAIVLTVTMFLTEIVLTVTMFLTEIVLTVTMFLTEIVLTVTMFLTEIVLTVMMFLTEIVLTVMILLTATIFTVLVLLTAVALTVLTFSTDIVLTAKYWVPAVIAAYDPTGGLHTLRFNENHEENYCLVSRIYRIFRDPDAPLSPVEVEVEIETERRITSKRDDVVTDRSEGAPSTAEIHRALFSPVEGGTADPSPDTVVARIVHRGMEGRQAARHREEAEKAARDAELSAIGKALLAKKELLLAKKTLKLSGDGGGGGGGGGSRSGGWSGGGGGSNSSGGRPAVALAGVRESVGGGGMGLALRWVWQWKDDTGAWNQYSNHVNAKLEAAVHMADCRWCPNWWGWESHHDDILILNNGRSTHVPKTSTHAGVSTRGAVEWSGGIHIWSLVSRGGKFSAGVAVSHRAEPATDTRADATTTTTAAGGGGGDGTTTSPRNDDDDDAAEAAPKSEAKGGGGSNPGGANAPTPTPSSSASRRAAPSSSGGSIVGLGEEVMLSEYFSPGQHLLIRLDLVKGLLSGWCDGVELQPQKVTISSPPKAGDGGGDSAAGSEVRWCPIVKMGHGATVDFASPPRSRLTSPAPTPSPKSSKSGDKNSGGAGGGDDLAASSSSFSSSGEAPPAADMDPPLTIEVDASSGGRHGKSYEICLERMEQVNPLTLFARPIRRWPLFDPDSLAEDTTVAAGEGGGGIPVSSSASGSSSSSGGGDNGSRAGVENAPPPSQKGGAADDSTMGLASAAAFACSTKGDGATGSDTAATGAEVEGRSSSSLAVGSRAAVQYHHSGGVWFIGRILSRSATAPSFGKGSSSKGGKGKGKGKGGKGKGGGGGPSCSSSSSSTRHGPKKSRKKGTAGSGVEDDPRWIHEIEFEAEGGRLVERNVDGTRLLPVPRRMGEEQFVQELRAGSDVARFRRSPSAHTTPSSSSSSLYRRGPSSRGAAPFSGGPRQQHRLGHEKPHEPASIIALRINRCLPALDESDASRTMNNFKPMRDINLLHVKRRLAQVESLFKRHGRAKAASTAAAETGGGAVASGTTTTTTTTTTATTITGGGSSGGGGDDEDGDVVMSSHHEDGDVSMHMPPEEDASSSSSPTAFGSVTESEFVATSAPTVLDAEQREMAESAGQYFNDDDFDGGGGRGDDDRGSSVNAGMSRSLGSLTVVVDGLGESMNEALQLKEPMLPSPPGTIASPAVSVLFGVQPDGGGPRGDLHAAAVAAGVPPSFSKLISGGGGPFGLLDDDPSNFDALFDQMVSGVRGGADREDPFGMESGSSSEGGGSSSSSALSASKSRSKSAASSPDVDYTQLASVGETLVCIDDEVECKALSRGHGGWTSGMKRMLGCRGTVVSTTGGRIGTDLVVRCAATNEEWVWHPMSFREIRERSAARKDVPTDAAATAGGAPRKEEPLNMYELDQNMSIFEAVQCLLEAAVDDGTLSAAGAGERKPPAGYGSRGKRTKLRFSVVVDMTSSESHYGIRQRTEWRAIFKRMCSDNRSLSDPEGLDADTWGGEDDQEGVVAASLFTLERLKMMYEAEQAGAQRGNVDIKGLNHLFRQDGKKTDISSPALAESTLDASEAAAASASLKGLEHVWMNSKVCNKFEEQLSDPLVVASHAFPDWILSLTGHFSFLMPLPLKIQWLHMTAFGASRAVHNAQLRLQKASKGPSLPPGRMPPSLGWLSRSMEEASVSRDRIGTLVRESITFFNFNFILSTSTSFFLQL